MAITPSAVKALQAYVARADAAGEPHKETIFSAVVLTDDQRAEISVLLAGFWKKPMDCPALVDLKPHHGYRSRVLKDGFTGAEYAEWLVAGCSDVAEVSTDAIGRPNLIVRAVDDGRRVVYDILVPVRSNQDGHVHIDDVIPKGLPARQKKSSPLDRSLDRLAALNYGGL